MKWHEYGLAVSFVLSLKVLKSWNGKSGLFRLCAFSFRVFSKALKSWKGEIRDFCACFHSEISVISPFLSWPRLGSEDPLPRQTNTVTAAENANLLPDRVVFSSLKGEIVSLCFICSDGKMRWRFDVTSWIMNISLNMVIKGRSVHHPTAAAKIAFHLPRRRSWTLWNIGTAGKVR